MCRAVHLVLLIVCLPTARAQLVPLGGGEGGEIRDLVRAADGTIYAGAVRGGVYRTTNGGLTWEPFRTGMHAVGVNALALGPDGAVYAAGGRFTPPGFADGYGAVYRLAPGATTWTDVSGNLATMGGLAGFAVAAVSPQVLLVGTTIGVFRSADGGASWAQVPDVPGPVWELFRASDGSVYLGAHHDVPVRRSDDGGATWTAISTGIPGGPRTYVFEEAADGTIVTAPAQYYYTTDRGATWQQAQHAFPGGSTGFARAPDGTLFAADGSNLVRSTDDGRSWQYDGLNAPGVYFHVDALAVAPDGELLLSTRYGGVIRSNHAAGNWGFSNAGLTAARLHDMAVSTDGRIVAVGDGDVFTSTTAGPPWTARSTGGLIHESVAASPAVTLAGERNSRVYRLFPDGTRDFVAIVNQSGAVQALLALPGGRFVAVVGRRVAVSDDNGTTWTVTYNQGDTGFVLERGADGALYLVRDDGLFRSTDDGNTWAQLTQDYGTGQWIRGSALAAPGGGTIYMAYSSVLFRSTDGGATWTYTVHLPIGLAQALYVDPEGALWIGASGGLFRSTDGGVTLEDRSAGLYDPWVVDIVPVPSPLLAGGVRFLVGTAGGGVYGYDPVVTAGGAGPGSPLPASAHVSPNPVVGRAAVSVHLGAGSETRVEVLDVLGRRVALLHDGALTAGAHTLALDAGCLPAGAYVARVVAAGRATTHRFTVAR